MKYEFEIATEVTAQCDYSVEAEAGTENEARALAREEALRCARAATKGNCIYASATVTRRIKKGEACPKN